RNALDNIAERYSELQSPYQYGFVHPDNEEFSPDPKTTALVLETLSLLNRLDAVSLTGVSRYLEKSGEGISKYGLDLTRWATEGDFEYKYWLLRAAYAIDGTVLPDGTTIRSLKSFGVTQLSRDLVLSPDTNIADFDLPEPYLVWGNELLSPSDIYGGGFEAESYSRKLALVDTYRMMLEDEKDSPTLLRLLFDTDELASEVMSYYDNELLMFQDTDGQLSLRATTDALEALDAVGKIEQVFSGDWAAYRYADSITFWENGVTEWEELARTDSGSLADRKVLSETSQLLDKVDDEKVTYTPTFGENVEHTGVSDWVEHSRTPGHLLLTDIFWEYYQQPVDVNESSKVKLDLGFLPIGIFILIGAAFSFASDSKTLKGLSMLCIIFFVFQVVFMDTSIFEQMSEFVSSVIPSYSRPMADMTAFGTTYLTLTYPEITEQQDVSAPEMFIPEAVNPYTTSWVYTPTIPQLTLDGFTAFPHLLTTAISSDAVFFVGDYAIAQVDLMSQIRGLRASSLVTLDSGAIISESASRGCWEFNYMPHAMGVLGLVGPIEAILAQFGEGEFELQAGITIFENQGDGTTHQLVQLKHIASSEFDMSTDEGVASAQSLVSSAIEGRENTVVVHIVSEADYQASVEEIRAKNKAQNLETGLTKLDETSPEIIAEGVLHIEGLMYKQQLNLQGVDAFATFILDDKGTPRKVGETSTDLLDSIFIDSMSKVADISSGFVDQFFQAVSTWYTKWKLDKGLGEKSFFEFLGGLSTSQKRRIGIAYMLEKNLDIEIEFDENLMVGDETLSAVIRAVVDSLDVRFKEFGMDSNLRTFYVKEIQHRIPQFISKYAEMLPKDFVLNIGLGVSSKGNPAISLNSPTIGKTQALKIDISEYKTSEIPAFPVISIHVRNNELSNIFTLGDYDGVELHKLVGAKFDSLSQEEEEIVSKCKFLTIKTGLVVPNYEFIANRIEGQPDLVSAESPGLLELAIMGLSVWPKSELRTNYDISRESSIFNPGFPTNALIGGMFALTDLLREITLRKSSATSIIWESEEHIGDPNEMANDVLAGQILTQMKADLPHDMSHLVPPSILGGRDHRARSNPILVMNDWLRDAAGASRRVSFTSRIQPGQFRMDVREGRSNLGTVDELPPLLSGLGSEGWVVRQTTGGLLYPASRTGYSTITQRNNHPATQKTFQELLLPAQFGVQYQHMLGPLGPKLTSLVTGVPTGVPNVHRYGKIDHHIMWTDSNNPIFLTSSCQDTGLAAPLVISDIDGRSGVGFHVFDQNGLNDFGPDGNTVYSQLLQEFRKRGTDYHKDFVKATEQYLEANRKLHGIAQSILALRQKGVDKGDPVFRKLITDALSEIDTAKSLMISLAKMEHPKKDFDRNSRQFPLAPEAIVGDMDALQFIRDLQLRTMTATQYMFDSCVFYVGTHIYSANTVINSPTSDPDSEEATDTGANPPRMKMRSAGVLSYLVPESIRRTLERSGLVDTGSWSKGNTVYRLKPVVIPFDQSRHDSARESDLFYLLIETNRKGEFISGRLYDDMGKVHTVKADFEGIERYEPSAMDEYHAIHTMHVLKQGNRIRVFADEVIPAREFTDLVGLIEVATKVLEEHKGEKLPDSDFRYLNEDVKSAWADLIQILVPYVSDGNKQQISDILRNTAEFLGVTDSIYSRLKGIATAVATQDPGPSISDINWGHINAWVHWYGSLFTDPPLEALGNTELEVDPFLPLGLTETQNTLSDGWLSILMADTGIEDEVKNLVLNTYAMNQMGSAPLCDDWPYPPYELGEWRFVGEGVDEWHIIGSPDSLVNNIAFGDHAIHQEIKAEKDIDLDRVQLFLTNIDDLYNSKPFEITVDVKGEIVKGS
ncbi:MAG: hypothetical protein RTU92_08135, partial [Candidatus Thorarchaeota archaeon]